MRRIATDSPAPLLRRLKETAHTAGRYQRLARRLGPHTAGRRDQATVHWFAIRLAVAKELTGQPAPRATFRLRSGPQMTIGDSSELIAMGEVFVKEEYRLELPEPPRTVLDCGANVGFASAYFAARYPEATVYAVEADPSTFVTLEQLSGQLANVRAVHRAVTGSDGPVTFHSSARSMGSSMFARHNEGDTVVEVPGSSLATLLDELGIERVDLLKLDVEGAEFDLLEAARPVLDRIGTIVAEIHFDLAGSEEGLRAALDGFEVDLEAMGPPGRFLLNARRRGGADTDAG